MRCFIRPALLTVSVLVVIAARAGERDSDAWVEVARIAAPDARQAAAADREHVFVVASEVVAKYERSTGRLLARSQGEARHLNSAFLHEGQLYLAHSNYPEQPERSQILRLDPATMRLASWHDFGASEGSLTWCVFHDGAWWCHFAFYGDERHKSYVARFDADWREVARWRFPAHVVEAFDRHSASGGLWRDGRLLVTGHDRREVYVLELPAEGNVLQYIATQSAPFAGQGFAEDPVTGGLIGIDRARRLVIMAQQE
jgi:hypothetical protein